ncbi:NAD(P)H-binding protein [Amycolatopsis albispora]|uniref:NmrA family transcriptional regulator n=1 Tax=Amycolatopsis albispora TaxID=1804986 RepID=A0A344L3E7_9PSEU|nr:NAD(P)H-binding protein [Amycolatopsis albispora]AXB42571.1 NmrA family transcriptional regulator [Amycolatopsis albispora]
MIVVTGATGNVGRPLVRALADAGEQVVAVSRGRTATDAPPGVRTRQADVLRPETLRPALDGASALFLLTPGGVELPEVAALARDAGIRRVVLLSSLGVATGRHSPATETAVTGTSPEWTVLRPGGFHSNTFAWAEGVRSQRAVAAPFAEVALPTVDPGDIAEVAAAALTRPGHHGRTYLLTGPAPITPRQQAAAIAHALGEPVRFHEQTRAEAREQLLGFMPEPVAEATLDILGHPLPAEREVSPDIERVLGRPPRDFAGWAARNVVAFK